jgi:hypothetical protein
MIIEKVQVLNPKTQCYVLIDKTNGRLLGHRVKKNTPYKNVPIVTNTKMVIQVHNIH